MVSSDLYSCISWSAGQGQTEGLAPSDLRPHWHRLGHSFNQLDAPLPQMYLAVSSLAFPSRAYFEHKEATVGPFNDMHDFMRSPHEVNEVPHQVMDLMTLH